MSSFWAEVRKEFLLDPLRVNLAALALAPHHHDVRDSIREYAGKLDRRGFPFLSDELIDAEARVRKAAADYLGVKAEQIALIDSTTQGLGLLFAGLRIAPHQRILTSRHEFFVSYKCLASRQEREWRKNDFVKEIDLFDDLPNFCGDDVVRKIRDAIDSSTRILALTWVYSNTGVKLPIPAIGRLVKAENARRPPDERIIFCVDAVHGLGVEDTSFEELNCDFLVSGCHKWIFGPRGTGVWVGTDEAWRQVLPIIPSTTGSKTGAFSNTPGGLHSYELRWATDRAFEFLTHTIGKRRVQQRVHALASRMKSAFSEFPHIRLVTPISPEDSSGIICFDVLDSNKKLLDAVEVEERLARAGVIVTTSSQNRAFPDRVHVRVAVSILNTDHEIERAIDAIRDLV